MQAAPAVAAEVKVSITDETFKPAVVVVPPETDVVWTNNGLAIHGVKSDDFPSSPTLMPGQTGKQRFNRLGIYDYTDAFNAEVTGTVIVAAAVRPPKRKSGGRGGKSKTYKYKGSFRLDVRETYKFYDDKWRSTNGACNAQVGGGTRNVTITANLKKAEYTRLGTFEGFESEKQPAKANTYVEQMTSKIADGSAGPFTPLCQDGTTTNELSAVHEADCAANRSGERFKLDLRWVRSVNRARFMFSSDKSGMVDQCGPEFVGGLSIVGVELDDLPLNVVGGHLLRDSGATSPATADEVRRMRTGKPFTIKRELRLRYTANCCTGFNPRTSEPTGVWARTGTVMEVVGGLTVKLRRR